MILKLYICKKIIKIKNIIFIFIFLYFYNLMINEIGDWELGPIPNTQFHFHFDNIFLNLKDLFLLLLS